MNWAELLNRMAHWQRKQFPKTTTYGAASHLHKEVIEIANAAMNGEDDPEEWADALHLAIQGGTLAAGSLNKFMAVVEAKLLKNELRQWPDEPDKDNVYEHLEMDTLEDTPTMSRKVLRNPGG